MGRARAADGAWIAFDVAGDGGDPVVLLSGQANSRHWWDPVRADFAREHVTIAVDALGTGESDAPRDAEYSTRRFAADVVAVLDDLGLERVHLYGTSMGGKVALWVALDRPDRVAALVLGCTSPGGAGGRVAAPEVLARLAGPPAAAREALIDLMYTPAYRRSHPGPYSVLGDDSMTPSARRGHRRASAEHDAWAQLDRIVAPTLVLQGTDDLFCPPENATAIAGRIGGAELRVIDGARHAYFDEFRVTAGEAVLRFIDRHPL
jgi:3-oxoadipate enol-lactonase